MNPFYELFVFIWNILAALQGMLVAVWQVFFFNARVLYSSETVMMATPLLILLLVAWRMFGPAEQTASIAMQGYDQNEPPTMVNERTYGGGGNFSGRIMTSEQKKDK